MKILVGVAHFAPAFVAAGLVQAFLGPYHMAGFIVGMIGLLLWTIRR